MKLRFRANTPYASDSDVVIYQKNLASYEGKQAVAWQVFKHPAKGDVIDFTYPETMQMAVEDSSGQLTALQEVAYGELWEAVEINGATVLMLAGDSASSAQIQFQNNLSGESVTANIYRDEQLIATTSAIAPGQEALFQFIPDFWMGVVPEAEAGQVLTSGMIYALDNQISCLGIASADIVMTGGSSVASSKPFTFEIKHVVPS